MISHDDHDDIVARFYASAAGEAPWTKTLADFAGRFNSGALTFQIMDASSKIVASETHGYSPEFASAFYASDTFAKDPRTHHIMNVKPGSIYYDHMLFDVAEMDRNSAVRETIDVLKVKYQLGAVLRLPNQATAIFALLNTPGEGHASQSIIRSFRRLTPHIEQACALGQIVEREALTRAALLDALARKSDGVMLLDVGGAPAFANDAASQILAADDGLRYLAGAFVTQRSAETRHLQKMIGEAISASLHEGEIPGGQMLVTRPSGRRPYIVRVLPVPASERFFTRHTTACVMHIQDLARINIPSKESLCTFFGLTEREADFAIELVRCTALEGAAANTGMAVNTARNHMQSIFRKTGTANQAEAIQLFGRLL